MQLLIGAIASGLVLAAAAQMAPPPARLVLKGYDPVAYFTENRAVKGAADITFDFDDGRYLFANARHRQAFTTNPDRYLPQFAGFCTAGLAKGQRAEANPEYFMIANGKLYTFSSQKAKDAVLADPALLARAEKHWREGK
jgi:YHS domain-containing protein